MTARFLLLVASAATLGAGCATPDDTLTASARVAMRDSLSTTLDAFRRAALASQWDSVSHMYADDSMTFVHRPTGWRIISGHTSSPRS